MNIRHLEILEAIEETGTFTGAARKLHLTQSAVSHAVAELEQEAGTALFDRLPKGACLTQCGMVLLEEGRGILNACRDLERKLSHLEENTPINVVSSITIASFLLPPILSRMKSLFPEIQINVRVVSANTSMEILKRGEADIAFWEGTEPQGAFRTIPLGVYKLYAACVTGYPLPEQPISLDWLCRQPLLLREPGSAIRDTFDSVLSLAGQRAYPVWESVNSSALIKAAEAGLGITVLPENLLADSLRKKSLQLVEVEGMTMENRMLAVLHKDKYLPRPMQIMLENLMTVTNQKKTL